MSYQYFKYLDLDWQPASKKLAEFAPDVIKTSKQRATPWLSLDTEVILKHAPELAEMLEPLKATIALVAFFVTVGDTKIHIDCKPNTKNGRCRINIPILNCDNTETHFFKCNTSPKAERFPCGGLFYRVDEAECTYVDHFSLTQAVFFKTYEPHKVVSHHDRVRISCTMELRENLEYLLE